MNSKLTPKQKRYIIAGWHERILFQHFWKKHKDFDILQVSKVGEKVDYDAIIYSGESQYLTEIKYRNCRSDTYKEGYILEKEKWDKLSLIQEDAEENYGIFYINFFTDNKLFIWDLREVVSSLEPVEKTMRKTTMGDDKVVKKLVYILPPEWATPYEFNMKEYDFLKMTKIVCEQLYMGEEFLNI